MTSKDTPTIAISGSSGFIGAALASHLEKLHFKVIRLVRSSKSLNNNQAYWDPEKNKIDLNRLENLSALISLGGENIAAKRWSKGFKEKLEESRLTPTKLLAESINQLKNPPPLWLSASAIGFYGDKGTLEIDESCPSGSGFLADLTTKWEEATKLKVSSKTRIVNLRFGLVLGKKGGPLSKMLLPFSFGLGAILGDGKNYMSWIAISDLLRALHHILICDDIRGAVNLTTPNSVTNYEFSKSLASALNRACFLKIPAFILRILLGEIADQALLTSQRVLPKKLIESGFTFLYPDIDSALQAELLK